MQTSKYGTSNKQRHVTRQHNHQHHQQTKTQNIYTQKQQLMNQRCMLNKQSINSINTPHTHATNDTPTNYHTTQKPNKFAMRTRNHNTRNTHIIHASHSIYIYINIEQ